MSVVNKDVGNKMKINKLAVLRSDVGDPCPYGLSIPVSCKNVGDVIYDLQVLSEVPEEERERYKDLNRRVYRHKNEGKPCPFLEGVIGINKKLINCDWGEPGAGSHAVPFRGSPFYPRIWNGINSDLYVSPFGNFTNDSSNRQMMDGMFSMYAGEETPEIVKQNENYYEFDDGVVEASVQLPEELRPSHEQYRCFVRDVGSDIVVEDYETNSFSAAIDWANSRRGPGKLVDLECNLDEYIEIRDDSPQIERIKIIQENPHIYEQMDVKAARSLLYRHYGAYNGEPAADFQMPQFTIAWLETTNEAFLRYTSVDDGEFELKYKKIEQRQHILVPNNRGGFDFYRIGDETKALFTADSRSPSSYRW